MNKFIKNLRIISISLGVIVASGLIYNLILFAYLHPRVLNFEVLGEQMETLGILTGLSLALTGIFHLLTVGTLLLQVAVQKLAGTLKILTFVIGIISGLLLLSDLAMLQDIGKQYEMGWSTAGEWMILFINHGLHILFTVLAFLTLTVKSQRKSAPEEVIAKDEVLFVAAHTTGLLCGWIGLIIVILALVALLPIRVIEVLSVLIGFLVLLPYLLILGIWLFMKRKEKIRDWLDEKQFQDVSRASLLTLIILVPCMFVISILQRVNAPGNIYDFIWFPLYIFLSMVVLSSATLYSIRR